MKCTSCGLKLDMRKKKAYVYASYTLASKGILGLLQKHHWVFCNGYCEGKADGDFIAGKFEKLHGKKMIDFKP